MSQQAWLALYTHGLRQALQGRRLAGLVAIGLAPALLAFTAKAIDPGTLTDTDLEPVFFLIGLGLVVPLVALFLGVDVVRGELEDGTIVHLVTRPVPRATVLLARLASAITVTFAASAVALSLTAVAIGGNITNAWLASLQIAALSSIAYPPLFALLGSLTKRGILLGLIYIVAWENVVAASPLLFREFTVAYWLRSIVVGQRVSRSDVVLDSISGEPAALATSILVLLGVAIVSAALGALWFQQRELVGAEPE